jgi:hypothetical protein
MCVSSERSGTLECVFDTWLLSLGRPGRPRVILLATSRRAVLSIFVRTHHANMDRRGRVAGLLYPEIMVPGHPIGITTRNILRFHYQSLHNDKLRSCRLASGYGSPEDLTPTPYPRPRTIHRRAIQLSSLPSWSRENGHR